MTVEQRVENALHLLTLITAASCQAASVNKMLFNIFFSISSETLLLQMLVKYCDIILRLYRAPLYSTEAKKNRLGKGGKT